MKDKRNQIWSFIDRSISYKNSAIPFLTSITVPPRLGLFAHVFPLNVTKPGTDIGIFVIVSQINTISCSNNHVFNSLDSNLLRLLCIFKEPITSCLGPLTLKPGTTCLSPLHHGWPHGVCSPVVWYIPGLPVWLSQQPPRHEAASIPFW